MKKVRFFWTSVFFCFMGVTLTGLSIWLKNGQKDSHQNEEKLISEARVLTNNALGKDAEIKAKLAFAVEKNTARAWEDVATASASIVNEDTRKKLQMLILPKQTEAIAKVRDERLAYAGKLSEINPKDPMIKEVLEAAKKTHKQIEEILKEFRAREKNNDREMFDHVAEEDRIAWSIVMRNLNAFQYYSGLSFIPANEPKVIDEAFKNALVSLQRVLIDTPHDTHSEYAIEALWVADKEKNNGAGDGKGKDAPTQPASLPKPMPNSGSTAPNEGI